MNDKLVWLQSKLRLPVVMMLVLLPWLAVVFATAGVWASLCFVAYVILVSAAGYGIARITTPASIQSEIAVLSPAAGILAISALTALSVRSGMPLAWTPVIWLALMGVGMFCLWHDRDPLRKSTVTYGPLLVVLSALICLVYFLPAARNDGVERQDGSFNWIYPDTEFFQSMAAGIERGDTPPKAPGTAVTELLYHFGPYTPAAGIARLTGLNLGDAFARVTRGASLWALVLSSFGLGTLLSLKATGARFGGIMSVAGLFFYGSLLSLFTDEANSASHVTGAILFKIPDIAVLADGGPFAHLVLGHSVLHGLGAITAIMGLCLALREQEQVLTWRAFVLPVLPALAIAVNSVAGLYCVGITCILLFWGRLKSARAWLAILLMCALVLGALTIMGYAHSQDAAQTTMKQHAVWQWWSLTVWFLVGLGFRILGFRWISQLWKDPMAVLVVASLVGLLSLALLIHLDGENERYGIYYLQAVFSIFAFSRLTHRWWRSPERSQWTAQWLALATRGMLLLTACGALLGIYAYATHAHTAINGFRLKILLTFLLVAALAGASAMMKRSRGLSTIGSAAILGVLMIGFLGWIAPWLNYGMGRMKMDITLAPGEVRGLKRLGELSARGERFATNKHLMDSVAEFKERSYAYDTLSLRPVLLEGYAYHEVQTLPVFHDLLRDNDLMFTTTDPDTLRHIANVWGVHWLVARPGTDISLARPLPPWLVEQPDCGDLRIYRID